MKYKSELILPAGDLKKTKFAYKYGADACYGGLAKYSLRKAEVNFTFNGLKKAIELAHSLGKKFYITFNILARNYNFTNIKSDIKKISEYRPDAFIVSDPGLIQLIKNNSNIPIHLSTQANTTNWQSVKFWKEQGIKRIVLARELTLKEIIEIHKEVPKMELEIFVHGAMCISYSGRCLLSAIMTGREANQGDCAQPCRWKYKLKSQDSKVKSQKIEEEKEYFLEEKLRPGEYFPIEETKNGTYIMNSKDLRLIQYLPNIIKAEVMGLKIEGRNKSEYYLATIARTYRKALDAMKKDNFKIILPNLLRETEKISHRDYTTGFLFGKAKKGETYPHRQPIENYKFLGVIESSKNGFAKLITRNQIKVGDKVEIMTPNLIYQEKVQRIITDEESIKMANPIPNKKFVQIKFSKDYPKLSILRKKLD